MHRARRAATVLAVPVLLATAGGAAARRHVSACPPGQFAVDAPDETRIAPAFRGMSPGPIALGPGRLVMLGSCAGVASEKATPSATLVAARFARCGGIRGVRLHGRIAAPACTTLLGSVRGHHLRALAFSAQRVTSTTTTTLPVTGVTTTTLPRTGRCGDGIVDAGEACDGAGSCPQNQDCDATCTCVPVAAQPVFAQTLIAQALADGRIDLPTSLLYRGYAMVGDPALPDAFVGDVEFGEDGSLGPEIDALLADPSVTLTPEMTAALQAFSVRPNDPASYFSTRPPTPSLGAMARAQALVEDGRKCPTNSTTGKPDWRPFETANFVIWSCGGGDAGADTTGVQRLAAGTIAEQVWGAMVSDTGPPRDDNNTDGPAPQRRIDVYLVDTGNAQCDPRAPACLKFPADALAYARPVGPCVTDNGPPQSSGYIVAPVNSVPSTAPDESTPSRFRGTLAHEFFHLIEYASNLAPMGYDCSGPILKGVIPSAYKDKRTWLGEASANWAEHFYFAADDPDEWNALFDNFQTARESLTEGDEMLTLLSNGLERGDTGSWTLRPYEAWLYLYFWEQQGGGKGAVINLWRGSSGVTTPQGLTDLLDSRFAFYDNFRDFNVRNLNEDLTGDPIDPLWKNVGDKRITSSETPHYFRPEAGPGAEFEVTEVEELAIPIGIDPAAALYDRYKLRDEIRYLKLDFSGVNDAGALTLDIVAHEAGDNPEYWVRRKFGGAIVEFCRDQQGWDYDDFRLVVSNTSHADDATVTGPYKVTARTVCPEEWSGYITVTTTVDESGPNYERHESDRQRWTISATSQTPPPGVPPGVVGDFVDLSWSATYQNSSYSGGQCPTSIEDSGTGHDTTHASVLVAAGRMFLSAVDPAHAFDINESYADCGSQSTATTTGGEELEVALAGAGGAFPADPNDPNSYVGQATPINVDETFADGSEHLTRQTVQWNFQRIIPSTKTP
jgi:hypothetical protein